MHCSYWRPFLCMGAFFTYHLHVQIKLIKVLIFYSITKKDCVKFRGSRAILPLCLCGSKTFTRKYLECPKFFSCGYFVGSKCFRWYFVNTKALSLVFRGSEDFTGGFLVGPKVSSLGKWWVLNFFLWVTRE